MFVDDHLLDRIDGLSLRLHEPTKKEVVLETNVAPESAVSGAYHILHDGEQYRLYYRGHATGWQDPRPATTHVAFSKDGIHFTRPKLGLIEHQGSRDNNIVFAGEESNCFFVFKDENPDAPPDQRYKAIVSPEEEKLFGMVSPDGLRWRHIQKEPLQIPGYFDSVNVAWWDANWQGGCYRSFTRNMIYIDPFPDVTYVKKPVIRQIQHATSRDFLTWTPPVRFEYSPASPAEQHYTNGIAPCPGAEHILLGFPTRMVEDRKKPWHPHIGVTDALFMCSRDGEHWDRRFRHAWVRPGLDPKDWTERNNMVARGIFETAPGEFSMYISENYRHDTNRLRRMTIRKHGFASLHSDTFPAWGEAVTKPLIFTGSQLRLNFATSAAGGVRVEVQDVHGRGLPGFRAEEMDVMFGNELDAPVSWKGASDGKALASLQGKAVRFRFLLSDADLYAFRTA